MSDEGSTVPRLREGEYFHETSHVVGKRSGAYLADQREADPTLAAGVEGRRGQRGRRGTDGGRGRRRGAFVGFVPSGRGDVRSGHVDLYAVDVQS